MGKGISLEELNRKNPVQKRRLQPIVRSPQKISPVKSEAQFVRELGQQLAQFERKHFIPREQKQAFSSLTLCFGGLFVGILICLFCGFLFVSWEIFQANRGNFYFWAYVFIVPFMIIIGGASDNNWTIMGLIVLIIGWFYWAWLQLLGHAYV